MWSFAVSANGSTVSVFLLDQKVYLSHFSNAKYVEIVKVKEYARKKKKNNRLENHA